MSPEFSKTQFLKDFFTREVFSTIFLLLTVIISVKWVSIVLESLELPKYLAYVVFSVESFLFIGAGLLLSMFSHNALISRCIWFLLAIVALVSWGYLSFLNLSDAGGLALVAIMFAVGAGATIKDYMWSHVMGYSQAMKYGSIYLALQMVIHTICNLLGTTGAGFIADISFNLLAVACFIGITVAMACSYKFYPKVKRDGDLQIWNLIHCPKKFYLLMLSAVHNMVAMPIRFVIVPLYFYDKNDGDLRSVGVWLGLVTLFALLGNVAKRMVSSKEISTFPLMVWGVLLGYVGYGLWWMFFDSMAMALFALLVGSISSPIWSYGYFSELNKLDPGNGSFLMYQWNFINSITIGALFVLLASLGYLGIEDFMTSAWIGFYSISGIMITAYFTWWWKRQ